MGYLIKSLNIGALYWLLTVIIFFTVYCISKKIPVSLLVAYISFVLFSTVISRRSRNYFMYELIPFWSYYRIFIDKYYKLAWECVFNVVMMLPIGLLLPMVKQNITVKKVVLFSLVMNIVIELSQLFTKTGLFEWDDMIHGMIGAATGCLIYRLLLKRRL